MSYPEIENLLRRKIGIDAKIINSRKITKAVETRSSICGVSNVDNYLQILHTSNQEFDELVELIVVPETWFFRDNQPYHALTNYVRSQWLNKPHNRKLRLLSVPCSTGEEPYSLAMTLLNLGLLPTQFHIDAVDISKKSLAKAKKGIYSRNSFRSQNLEFQTRYFIPVDKEYQICDQVKNTVNFSQGNLIDSQFLIDKKSYDIIWCRNVLIYFDSPSRKITLKNLNGLLKSGGIIFFSASEIGELANLGLEIVRLNGVFLGQKKIANPANVSLNYPLVVVRDNNIQDIKEYTKQPINVAEIPLFLLENCRSNNNQIIQSQDGAIKKHDYNLDTIRNLADEGNLTAAISQCQNYLQTDFTNAEAYVLLGQIYQAQKLESKAEECFQKAVYLDPQNSQALLHLTLLKEQRGDITRANILRQRWQRLHQL
ncbi:protein-glutamate O-methyltransferase CheR [Anabaena sp. PCC 7108]|uniref:CheR family methyltransferase n=1 Tax=Anabaena sp. PCC 7108 TaxID=163908 RepID=UPI00034BB998|nr:protein-glutamate O-methyltransferase CheR [Anabaena sp. PCC 7108]